MIRRTVLSRRSVFASGCAAGAVLFAGFLALANNRTLEDQERKVTEAEVPKAALDALRKLAGGAAFTEFAEEIEHGHKFYEGSWRGPNGKVDALVTETGDVVEIEEMIPNDQVPAAALAEVQKEAGKDAKLVFEKKTMILYEVHFKQDGKGREIILSPDGRQMHEEGEAKGEKENKDEDEGG
jgi:uncharacterized membrane protein YkoI